MRDRLDLAKLSDVIRDIPFGSNLHHLASVTSTNRLALEAAQNGAASGAVWVADEQTAGRGRGGHRWHSSPGDGLYVSILVRPRMALAEALWLSLATGLAAQAAIAEATGLQPDLRWPNDLLLNGRKCGGILVETSSAVLMSESISNSPAMLRHAVIGVGINVNHESFPEELQALATSLRRESGIPYMRQALLTGLLRALHREIAGLEAELSGKETGAPLLARFAAASTWVRGKRVRVDEGGGYTGVTAGLDARGFLLVAADDGLVRTVLSGGVREE